MINPSLSNYLKEVNRRKGLNLTESGDQSGLQMVPRQIKALELGVLLWNKAETKFWPWAVHDSIPGRSVCHKGMHS
jgi:hypothetical protein